MDCVKLNEGEVFMRARLLSVTDVIVEVALMRNLGNYVMDVYHMCMTFAKN